MEDDNTQSLETESDRNVAYSCNGNLSTNKNKLTKTCELNNNRETTEKGCIHETIQNDKYVTRKKGKIS